MPIRAATVHLGIGGKTPEKKFLYFKLGAIKVSPTHSEGNTTTYASSMIAFKQWLVRWVSGGGCQPSLPGRRLHRFDSISPDPVRAFSLGGIL